MFAEDWYHLRPQIGELLAQGKSATAESLLRETLQSNPDSAELHAQLGTFLHQFKRYEEAIEELGKSVQLDGANPEYSMSLAEALLAARRFPTAVEFLSAVKQRFGGTVRYHYNLGVGFYGARDFAAALKEFEAVGRLDPALDMGHYFRGNCLAAMGRLPEAEAAYRKALGLQPARLDYVFALGKVLTLIGPERLGEAIQLLEQAGKIDASHVPSRFYLALAYERTGRLLEARDLLEKLTAAHPDRLEPSAALARIYYRLKQRERGDELSARVRHLRQKQESKPAPAPSLP